MDEERLRARLRERERRAQEREELARERQRVAEAEAAKAADPHERLLRRAEANLHARAAELQRESKRRQAAHIQEHSR